jgi:hypothetical protein
MAKYELFQRLNTGGSMLSDQEVRNSILVMMNLDLYKWMRALSLDQNFVTCTALSDRAVDEQYDMELVSRFVVFRTMSNAALRTIGDVGEFLTEKAKAIAQDKAFDYKKEEAAFRDTFTVLASTLADDAFRRYDKGKGRFVGGFSVSAFEAVAVGIGYNPKIATAKPSLVEKGVKDLWGNAEFVNNSGSGIRASSRIPKVVPFGRTVFAK